ncbi:MAG TPA: lipopolysaccharide assembly protein LapA domain-containing protein [Planctomycetota bacterium]|nr:lipopolysaccharide assembly protein LapA domain-containing protein [Planctomycetota bacterium]
MNLAKIRQIIGWTLVALLVVWIFLNRTSVHVHFLIFETDMPVALVIVLSAAAGAGAVFAFKYLKKIKKGDAPSA